MEQLVEEQKPVDMVDEGDVVKEIRSHVAGFAIDEPANDDEEEDDDELALAALESLDAIEVFKQDQKVDRLTCDNPAQVDPGLFEIDARVKNQADLPYVQAELLAAVQPACGRPVQDVGRLGRCRRGDAHRQVGGPLVGQGRHPGPAP